MNNVLRWDPFRSNPLRELENIGERFNRFFDRLSVAPGNGEAMTVADWVPNVDIAAEFKDGMLMVHLPKSEKAKPKTLEVKVA